MTRRDLLSIFASLPMFGWLKPKPKVELDPEFLKSATRVINRYRAMKIIRTPCDTSLSYRICD